MLGVKKSSDQRRVWCTGAVAEKPHQGLARLIDVVHDLANLPRATTIYAVSPWAEDSVAVVGPRDEPPSHLAYLLEVELAQEAVEVWSEWRGGRVPDDREACRAVIYYAEHDAYQPVDQDEPRGHCC
jgi:hypothetical protein